MRLIKRRGILELKNRKYLNNRSMSQLRIAILLLTGVMGTIFIVVPVIIIQGGICRDRNLVFFVNFIKNHIRRVKCREICRCLVIFLLMVILLEIRKILSKMSRNLFLFRIEEFRCISNYLLFGSTIVEK